MMSGGTKDFNTIRSEKQVNNNKLKRNNTHVYISKRIQNKKYLGKLTKNIDFDNNANKKEDKDINDFNEDEK